MPFIFPYSHYFKFIFVPFTLVYQLDLAVDLVDPSNILYDGLPTYCTVFWLIYNACCLILIDVSLVYKPIANDNTKSS